MGHFTSEQNESTTPINSQMYNSQPISPLYTITQPTLSRKDTAVYYDYLCIRWHTPDSIADHNLGPQQTRHHSEDHFVSVICELWLCNRSHGLIARKFGSRPPSYSVEIEEGTIPCINSLTPRNYRLFSLALANGILTARKAML